MGRSRVQCLDELGKIFGVGREIEILAVIRPWGDPIISLRVGSGLPKSGTWPDHLLMSQKCQVQTHALRQTASYSITSSASESRLSEILTPCALAVFMLMTNSNFVT